jgi:hypothetical protein
MVNPFHTPSQPTPEMVNPSQPTPELVIPSPSLLMLSTLPFPPSISPDMFAPSPAPLQPQLLSPDPQQSCEKNWCDDGYNELLVIFKNENLK